MDRYPLQCPNKGGFTTWNPTTIFITCPRIPNDEFVRHTKDMQGNNQTEQFEDVEQVNRRCTTIRTWNENLNTWIWIKGGPTDEWKKFDTYIDTYMRPEVRASITRTTSGRTSTPQSEKQISIKTKHISIKKKNKIRITQYFGSKPS